MQSTAASEKHSHLVMCAFPRGDKNSKQQRFANAAVVMCAFPRGDENSKAQPADRKRCHGHVCIPTG